MMASRRRAHLALVLSLVAITLGVAVAASNVTDGAAGSATSIAETAYPTGYCQNYHDCPSSTIVRFAHVPAAWTFSLAQPVRHVFAT